MRRFSADYLDRTREGLWADRAALAPLRLPERDSVLDVGCGTGELARVCREESAGRVAGMDRDPALLAHLPAAVDAVRGDAVRADNPTSRLLVTDAGQLAGATAHVEHRVALG